MHPLEPWASAVCPAKISVPAANPARTVVQAVITVSSGQRAPPRRPSHQSDHPAHGGIIGAYWYRENRGDGAKCHSQPARPPGVSMLERDLSQRKRSRLESLHGRVSRRTGSRFARKAPGAVFFLFSIQNGMNRCPTPPFPDGCSRIAGSAPGEPGCGRRAPSAPAGRRHCPAGL